MRQTSPQAAVEWQALRLSGQDALAVRASKKLRSDELLVTGFAGTRLRMELDRVPLWRGDHVPIKQVAEDLKLLGFDRGVTLHGGLPVPIATCASGTAFDIVGRNVANVEGMQSAFDLVAAIAARTPAATRRTEPR